VTRMSVEVADLLLDPDMIDRMIEHTYNRLVMSASRVWLCQRSDDPTLTIRFIPKAGEEEAPKVSSSMIRNMIQNSLSGQLEPTLSDLVLTPISWLQFLGCCSKASSHDAVGGGWRGLGPRWWHTGIICRTRPKMGTLAFSPSSSRSLARRPTGSS
jgi:hypothetical protein